MPVERDKFVRDFVAAWDKLIQLDRGGGIRRSLMSPSTGTTSTMVATIVTGARPIGFARRTGAEDPVSGRRARHRQHVPVGPVEPCQQQDVRADRQIPQRLLHTRVEDQVT